jgi:[ribosomal protein S5]-alanine N-acetyltransferase
VIRPLRPDDAEELAALYRANRDFLARFEPVRQPEFFTPEAQRERIAARAADDFHQFAILDGDAIAGTISVFHIVREALQSGTVGYWVDRERNGRGLATAAVEEVVGYMFGELGLHRAEAATLIENVASQRVLEKAAFEQIGLARRYLRIDDEWRDFLLFQRLAD